MPDDFPRIRPETVDALVDAVQLFLDAEDRREQSFNARAGGLAGFAGVIVSVATTGGKLALDAGLSRGATVAAGIVFGLAAILLFGAMLVAIAKILVPQESAAISIGQIERFPNWEYIAKPREMVQGELLHGLIAALAQDRKRNGHKATWLRRAYVLLLLGVGLVAVFAGILVLDAA